MTGAELIARADEIDNRLGPIPGHVADAIAVQLREAAGALAWRLAKRPVAFRVKNELGCWIYYDNEADAAAMDEKYETGYQALFVRDGS
jgi:hypothetical protein